MERLAAAIRLSSSTCQEELRQAQNIIDEMKRSANFNQVCLDLFENCSTFGLEPKHVFAILIQLHLWLRNPDSIESSTSLLVFLERFLTLFDSAPNMQILKLMSESLSLVMMRIETPILCNVISKYIAMLVSKSSSVITDQEYYLTPISNTVPFFRPEYAHKLSSLLILTVITARFRTVTNNRHLLNHILTPECVRGIVENLKITQSFIPRSVADYCLQYSLMTLAYSLSPIIVANVCLQIDVVYQTVTSSFHKLLNEAHYISSSLYTVIIFLIFFQNFWLVSFRIRNRAANIRTNEMNLFLEFWNANRLNNNIFQFFLTCLSYFSTLLSKPLPMSLNNVTCEHVLAQIYSFIATALKTNDPANQLAGILSITKEIFATSSVLMHQILGAHLARSHTSLATTPTRLFSLEPREIAALASEELDSLFYATLGTGMTHLKKDGNDNTEPLSQVDIGLDFLELLNEIVKTNKAIMRFLSQDELQQIPGKLSEMARQLLQGPIAAISSSGSGPQLVALDVVSSIEFFIALTDTSGALIQMRQITTEADIPAFDAKVGDLINTLLNISPYLSSFLSSRIFWFINEFMSGDNIITATFLLPALPMPVLRHLENSKSATEAYLGTILCKTLTSRLYILIEFHKEDQETSISQLLSNIQPSVMIGTLANLLAKTPSDTTFYSELFELMTSALEVCSFLDPLSTNQCLEMLIQSVLQTWASQAPEYNIFVSYYSQQEAIHPSIYLTCNILSTITTVCASTTIPLSHSFFCCTCSLVEHVFQFLRPLLEYSYSNLLTAAVSALGAVFSSKDLHLNNIPEKRNITCHLLNSNVEFILQHDELFDLLSEFLPSLVSMVNYLGVVGDRELVGFIHNSFALQISINPDYLLTSRLMTGVYLTGLITNFKLLSPSTKDSYIAIVDAAMRFFFDVPVNTTQGYSTVEQTACILLYMCLAAATLLTITTKSLLFFEQYNTPKLEVLFHMLPRTLIPVSLSCDLACNIHFLVNTLFRELSSFPQGQNFLASTGYGSSLHLSTKILASPDNVASISDGVPTREQIWNNIMDAGFFVRKQEDESSDADTFSLFEEIIGQIVSDSFVYMETILQIKLLSVSLDEA